MSETEQERILARIAEIQETLRHTRSPDLQETLRQAIADCRERLARIEARDQLPAAEGA